MGPRSTRTGPVALAVVTFALTALAATAAAAPRWSPPVTLGAIGRQSGPAQVVVTPGGEAIAVWNGGRAGGIQVSTRPPGKDWTPPVTLAPATEAGVPRVAANGRKAVVVWGGAVRSGGHWASAIMASTRLPGRRWGRPRDISAESRWREEPEGEEPQVALTRRGEAIVIWQALDEGHGTDSFIRTATQPPGGTGWTAPVGLPGSGEGEAPQIGATPAGESVAMWGANYDEETGLEVSSRPPGGRWTYAKRLASPGGFPAPQLAVTSKGEAIGAWEAGIEGSGPLVQVAVHIPGGRWKLRTLAPHDRGHHPTIVTGPGSRATVVWARDEASESTDILTAVHSPERGWAAAVNLAAAGLRVPGGQYPAFAVTGGGESIAVWAAGGYRGERTVIQASSSRPGKPWSAPTDLAGWPPGRLGVPEVQVAVARSGEAFAVWRAHVGGRWVIEAAGRPAP
jgi:hypothetical protein